MIDTYNIVRGVYDATVSQVRSRCPDTSDLGVPNCPMNTSDPRKKKLRHFGPKMLGPKCLIDAKCPVSVLIRVAVLRPDPQYGTHSHLAFATLPLPIPFVAFFKLTASSRPSAPPSDSPKCLRFGHWLTLCTIKFHSLTFLLTLETYSVLPDPLRQLERNEKKTRKREQNGE